MFNQLMDFHETWYEQHGTVDLFYFHTIEFPTFNNNNVVSMQNF
jgi:hypothetical protein